VSIAISRLNTRFRTSLLFGLLASVCWAGADGARAQNMIRLDPPLQAAEFASPTVDIVLELDFAEVTVGGGIEITWDAAIFAFDSFTFAADPELVIMDGHPDGGGNPQTQPAEIGAGWLVLAPPNGISGLRTIGTLSLSPVMVGRATIATTGSASNPGPFFPPGVGMPPLSVSYEGATVYVVPEPGIAIGLLFGVALLGALSRNVTRQAVGVGNF